MLLFPLVRVDYEVQILCDGQRLGMGLVAMVFLGLVGWRGCPVAGVGDWVELGRKIPTGMLLDNVQERSLEMSRGTGNFDW